MNNIHAEVDEILRTGNKKAIVSLFLSMQGNYIRATEAEAKLAEAQAEIERLALELEDKQYTITCASEENQQLKESLAEARAEIERIIESYEDKLARLIAHQIKTDERKDRLIEQMREALRAWVRTPDIPLHEAIKVTEAALEAAERAE